MAFWNKHLYEKYPDAQVPDPDGGENTYWVNGAVVYEHLVAELKEWDGEGFPDKVAFWCEDKKDANLVKVDGHWLACTRKQAREVAEALDLKDHIGPDA